jgi:carbonic anhydrase
MPAEMTPQEPRTAIVTCMDARLDAAGFLDEWPAAVHVVRNAGGRVTADTLRSLAASCAMGTERVVVIHHTDCAMAKHTDEEIRGLLPAGVDAAEVDFLAIDDPAEALARDVQAVRGCELLPAGIEVRAFVYDLDSRAAAEVEAR